MPLTKITSFTKKVTDLPDKPSPSYSPADIKLYIQTPSNELMSAINNNIDVINTEFALKTEVEANANNLTTHKTSSDHDGRYYTESEVDTKLGLKADKISTYTETEVNALLANKTNLTGNHQGTWQGFTPKQVDATVDGRISALEDDLQQSEYSSLLTQDSSTFTLGTGKDSGGLDVDVSSNVVNGQVSVRLKGRTVSPLSSDDFGDITGIDGSSRAFPSSSNDELLVTLNTTDGFGYSYKRIYQEVEVGKYYFIRCLTKIGTATSTKVLVSNGLGTSIDVNNTYLTPVGIKINPDQAFIDGNGYVQFYVAGNDTETGVFDKFMLVEISQDEYNDLTVDELLQKYNYVNSVKSTLSTRLKSVGKNLFDNKVFSAIDKRFGSASNGIVTDKSYNITDYIRVKAGKKYAMTNIASIVSIYDDNFNFVEGITSNPFTPSVDGYIRVSVAKNDIFIAQIEQGTTATAYEPYKESISNITLPTGEELRSLPNGTKDEVRDGVHYKRTDKDIVNTYNQTINYNTNRFYKLFDTTTTPDIKLDFDLPFILEINSQHIQRTDYNDRGLESERGKFFVADTGVYFIGDQSTTYDFTNSSLTYQLAEPIVTQLEGITPLQSFEKGTLMVDPYLHKKYTSVDDGAGNITITLDYPIQAIDSLQQVVDSQLVDVTGTLSTDGTTITVDSVGDYFVDGLIQSDQSTIPSTSYTVPLNRSAQMDDNSAMIRRNAMEIIRIYARLEVAGI